MKTSNKILINGFIFLMCWSSNLFTSCNKEAPVTDIIIELVQFDGSVHKDVKKSNVDHYVLIDSANSQVKEVRNLEKLTEIESINVYNVSWITDWSFLAGLPKLKSLGLSGVSLEDLQFISTLKPLESLTLERLYISAEAQKQTIDCSEFTKLKSIEIDTIPRITNIPNFVNVTTKPTLSIMNNEIVEISEDEAKILQQFSSIKVFDTPLTPKYINSTPWLKDLPISF